MEQLVFIETGTGTDVHGQDINVAARRAVENALHYNSMPGIRNILPENNLSNMKVNVKLGLPMDHDRLDVEAVKGMIPYGMVTVELLDGGLATSSGIYLEDQNDKNDLMYIVNAVVEVGY
ncbi:Lin0512 family protein [Salinicoccus sp. CNSTN-B1]